ncbi:endonuclease III [Desulfovibrio sp. OttesenSCG-928-G11]|nr:endonuclease III [Desulfovibrio sp. OttesenSCG-928-G11]
MTATQKKEKRTKKDRSLQSRAGRVLELLRARYPRPQGLLKHQNPWELLVATVLAAQCTDERVNSVTPALFARWPGPADLAGAGTDELEAIIRPTGFYRNKARNLLAAAARIRDFYGGRVPENMADLLTLPGLGRKTANVVLFGGFGINEGLAVDTHVGRIAWRLGFCEAREPLKAEKELTAIFPREEWGNLNHRLVWFGRQVCRARRPLCGECELETLCEKRGLGAALSDALVTSSKS